MKIAETKKQIYILSILSIICLLAIFFLPKFTVLDREDVMFSRCVDGDTAYFLIDGEEEKVRLLAIDTPETVKPNTPVQPFGREASDYTCKSLMSATNIKLEYEESNKVDKYNRKLAWIFVDDKLLQKGLLLNGLAKVKYESKEYKYVDELYQAQEYSKQQKVGVWQ